MTLLRSAAALLLTCIFLAGLWGCSSKKEGAAAGLQVVTTLFPLYDFSRSIGGSYAHVTMLLPPGVEPHTFEPRPEDMIRISRANLFIYTNRSMEPWAEKIITGINNPALRVVNAGERITYLSGSADDDHDHDHGHDQKEHHGHGGMDPHIWLDFTNAALMVDSICTGFVAADPAHGTEYRHNADLLKGKLAALDDRYRRGLSSCATDKLLHGGHFTFGYLARRYKLDYHALSGLSSDSEPSAQRMAALIRSIKGSGVKFLFAEELLSPRLSETLASEAGVTMLMLHGAHNLSKEEMGRNVSFIEVMEHNLSQLQKGLQCREK